MRDLRFAVRQLLKHPGFTAVAVVILALGIWATTAITSVVHTGLLEPLPVSEPDRLVRFVARHIQQGWTAPGLNPPGVVELHSQTSLFARLGLYEFDQLNLRGDDIPKLFNGLRVNTDFLGLWQVAPALGWVFANGEATPGSNQVVVLNHQFRQGEFGGDPAIVG